MNVIIPDKIYKLFILIGIILVAYTTVSDTQLEKSFTKKTNELINIGDSLKIVNFKLNFEKQQLLDNARIISKKYSVENPISYNDSTVIFNRILVGTNNEVKVTDLINPHWEKFSTKRYKFELENKKFEYYTRNIGYRTDSINKEFSYNFDLRRLGICSFILGVFLWLLDRPKDKKALINQKEKLYRFCQSCGQNFSSVREYSKRKNKEYNYAFCLNCYCKGKFKEPELTKEEAFKSTYSEIENKNFISKLLLYLRLNSLERWNKNRLK